jgi:hypothetical protein
MADIAIYGYSSQTIHQRQSMQPVMETVNNKTGKGKNSMLNGGYFQTVASLKWEGASRNRRWRP